MSAAYSAMFGLRDRADDRGEEKELSVGKGTEALADLRARDGVFSDQSDGSQKTLGGIHWRLRGCFGKKMSI
jgi:hypothetical protein